MDYPAYGHPFWFLVCITLAAALYSSVGQGGGSGYLAVMALFGVTPMHMKPAALLMNIFVTSVIWYRYHRAGNFRWDLFWPFIITSVPMAFVGGSITLYSTVYRVIVALALLTAALRLVWRPTHGDDVQEAKWHIASVFGAILGLISGMTGVGGGIFLSPLLLFFRWSSLNETFALSAGFIWVNSVAGILGYLFTGGSWPPGMAWMVLAVLFGALIGAKIFADHSTPQTLQRVLGVILVIAAIRILFDR